jgi:hypothetical protein
MKLLHSFIHKTTLIFCLIAITCLPIVGFGQPPGPGDAGGGGNPDGVPFDSNMNILFFIGAVVVAFWLIKRNFTKSEKIKELL